jgi:hypothetical protein
MRGQRRLFLGNHRGDTAHYLVLFTSVPNLVRKFYSIQKMGCNKNDVVSESKLFMGQTIQQDIEDVTIELRLGKDGSRHKIIHGISYLNKEDNNSTKMPVQKEQRSSQPTSLTDLLKQEDDKNNDQQNH